MYRNPIRRIIVDRDRVTDQIGQDEAGDATTGSGRDSRKCSATPAEHRKRANGEHQAGMAGSNIASGGSSLSHEGAESCRRLPATRHKCGIGTISLSISLPCFYPLYDSPFGTSSRCCLGLFQRSSLSDSSC